MAAIERPFCAYPLLLSTAREPEERWPESKTA
jgi:hypothetical protein